MATPCCTRTTSPTTTLDLYPAGNRTAGASGGDGLPEVGVIFGGPSPEHDVSILTGLQASRCLLDGGDRVHGIYWAKGGDWYEVDPGLEGRDFIDGPPRGASRIELVLGPGGGFRSSGRSLRSRQLQIDVALVCCHGGPGEDGTLQAALELAGVAHTGPSVAGAALGMDKLAFGAVVAGAGLPTLSRHLLCPNGADVDFAPPYIVKPRFGGSSIGIEVVADVGAALSLLRSSVHLSRGAVVEPYRADLFDLQIAVRSWPELQLSAIERPIRSGPTDESGILGYRDKYSGGAGMVSAPRELPAKVTSELEKAIHDATRRIASLCSIQGVARVDFLSDGSEIWVNEVNTIPGSLAHHLWVSPALDFIDLIRHLLAEVQSEQLRYSSTGADGAILSAASSIASKLA